MERPIQEIVARPDWQAIRSRMVGTWKHHPEMNIETLRIWLGPIQEASLDRLRIIRNYLTGSGFRIGLITHPAIDRLLDRVRREIIERRSTS